ncbi:TM2 domain-containing protein 3 [Desmophyllum pertusum]|uniref:TM2 domain-containing protein 3 n=1 Tax=Desmophyllum pertusum TaxID=174260 RepID=A0A9X0A180_9CNID|nr:TM2 domain-containing protein 3 [Desmophyllum pertusum]
MIVRSSDDMPNTCHETQLLTLGGFGADRFYLGHWREGLGKLFSFGGLGVWTLVDLILIIIGYVGPEDGSFYIF